MEYHKYTCDRCEKGVNTVRISDDHKEWLCDHCYWNKSKPCHKEKLGTKKR